MPSETETITANGDTLTRKEWAERCGLTREGFNQRVNAMLQPEKIKPGGREIKYNFNGMSLTLREISQQTGIGLTELRNRWNRAKEKFINSLSSEELNK